MKKMCIGKKVAASTPIHSRAHMRSWHHPAVASDSTVHRRSCRVVAGYCADCVATHRCAKDSFASCVEFMLSVSAESQKGPTLNLGICFEHAERLRSIAVVGFSHRIRGIRAYVFNFYVRFKCHVATCHAWA